MLSQRIGIRNGQLGRRDLIVAADSSAGLVEAEMSSMSSIGESQRTGRSQIAPPLIDCMCLRHAARSQEHDTNKAASA